MKHDQRRLTNAATMPKRLLPFDCHFQFSQAYAGGECAAAIYSPDRFGETQQPRSRYLREVLTLIADHAVNRIEQLSPRTINSNFRGHLARQCTSDAYIPRPQATANPCQGRARDAMAFKKGILSIALVYGAPK